MYLYVRERNALSDVSATSYRVARVGRADRKAGLLVIDGDDRRIEVIRANSAEHTLPSVSHCMLELDSASWLCTHGHAVGRLNVYPESSRVFALRPIAGKLEVGSAPSQADSVPLPDAGAALVVTEAALMEVDGAAETATDEQTQPSLLTQLLLSTAGKEEVGRAPSHGPLLVPVILLVPATLPVPAVPLLQAPLLIPVPPEAAVLLGQAQE
jgi:hypothetical protein